MKPDIRTLGGTRMKNLKLQYNAPVVLTFFFTCLAVLVLDMFIGDAITRRFFMVYRSPFSLSWMIRLFGHVLGHADFSHFAGNMLLFLVVAPPMEEKYGSRLLLGAIALTAGVSGLFQILFFPGTALLGASGIVFMLILLSSLSGMRQGGIPLTLILVAIFYLGQEIYSAIFVSDSVSQITHIIGGICGTVLGFGMYHGKKG